MVNTEPGRGLGFNDGAAAVHEPAVGVPRAHPVRRGVEIHLNNYPQSSRFGQAPQWTRYGGAGHYNDLDSLEIGNGDNDGITPDQRQAHLTLWAIAAAPLILGTDLTSLDGSPTAARADRQVQSLIDTLGGGRP